MLPLSDLLPDPAICALLVPGLGGPLLGLSWWLRRPQLGVVVAFLFALGAAAALVTRMPTSVWLPPLGLCVAHGLATILVRKRDTLLRLLASPRAGGIFFLALGPLVAGGWLAWYLNSLSSGEMIEIELPPSANLSSQPTLLSQQAYTDSNRPIPLYTRDPDEGHDQLRKAEQHLASTRSMNCIRTAPINASSNCHGWVFTGGQFAIHGRDVPAILADNGYRAVAVARAGDVVVYRDGGVDAFHTGIVRLTEHDVVIVESKWGNLGVYLHPIAEQPYGTAWTIYRSDRPDHVLQINSPFAGAEHNGR